MTLELAELMPRDRQLFDRSMGELLAAFVRRRWPRDTAKHVSRAWEIDPSTATNLTKGHASERTITKALKAEGWPLLIALGEAVTGESYQEFLRGIADETAHAAERARARADRVQALESRAVGLLSALDRPAAERPGRVHGEPRATTDRTGAGTPR